MSAIFYRAVWDVEYTGMLPPTLASSDDVIVQVRATGICGTDIGIISGQYHARSGVVLGHESTGTVVKLGSDVRNLRQGDRVVINPTFYCNDCRMCRTGRSNHCEAKPLTEAGVSADGTFAEYYRTKARFLHPLPSQLSYAAGSLTEPLSCCLTGVDQLRLDSTLRTVVVGSGPMGMLYAWALATRGVSGVVTEISPSRRLVAGPLLPPGWRMAESLASAVEMAGDGEPLIDLVVDTSGASLASALNYLARGGQVLLVGLKAGEQVVHPGTIADRSWSIIGSIDTLGNNFEKALGLLASNEVPGDRLVTHKVPMSGYIEAFGLVGCDLRNKKLGPPDRALKVVLMQAHASEQAEPVDGM